MLDYSELTIVKNSSGVPTALGYPLNSSLLQNDRPLFVGGGGKKGEDYKLAVPAGLVCMTQTICRPADEIANEIAANEMSNEMAVANEMAADENELIPEGLYERLLELAEVKEKKKMTKKHKHNTHKPKAKSSTKKHKKN